MAIWADKDGCFFFYREFFTAMCATDKVFSFVEICVIGCKAHLRFVKFQIRGAEEKNTVLRPF